MPENRRTEFERSANKTESGLISELLGFLRHKRKWILVPLIVMMLLLGGLILLSGTAAAPFIYTLF